jgi:hypothetical protein
MDREPNAARPHMPGYGIDGDHQGLLPWSWAQERLERSHDYWLATTWPDGKPHVMPVWGVFFDTEIWFSTSRSSRKASNLFVHPRVTVTTDNPAEPVIIDGVANHVTDLRLITRFAAAMDTKYHGNSGVEFYGSDVNACFRVQPETIFALSTDDFTGSPTRWRF